MDIEKILATYRHIAIAGISDNPERPSNSIARYLMHAGYTIYPVNPSITKVFGMPCYPSLASLPEEMKKNVEIVTIFRKPSDVMPIVDQAIEIGAKVIWMQSGIVNEEAAAKASGKGLDVVQNRCIAVEHQRLRG